MAKENAVILLLGSAVVFFIFCVNLGVLFWRRRKSGNWKGAAYSIPLLVFCSMVFVFCIVRAASTWIPAQRQTRMRLSDEVLARQPKIELKTLKGLIDSYCAESQRGVKEVHSGKDNAIQMLTGNPASPPEVFDYIADNIDDRSFVLRLIACRSNCPPKQINRFMLNPSLHESLAVNPAATLEVLEPLSRSTNRLVRFGVANNLNAPKTILERLANDPEARVNRAAKATLQYQSSRH